VDAKQVERTAEALGREIAQDERAVDNPSPATAPTIYLGMDGTGVPMRASELEGREGKQPDGSATPREGTLVTVWTAEARDDDGTPGRDEGSVTYSTAIERAASRDTAHTRSEFAGRVDREARRRGFDAASRRAVLGDGAVWIWTLVAEQLPGAIQIVDLYHAKQHLSDVAKALYGPGSHLGTQWAKQRHDELDDGKLDAVLHALRGHAAATDEARTCLGYVTRNQGRIRYPEFRAQGLCVGSGVVEAGCKVAIGTRPSSARACTGPSPGLTRSSPCAAASSAGASRTSGSAGPIRRPPPPGDVISRICRAPLGRSWADELRHVVRFGVNPIGTPLVCPTKMRRASYGVLADRGEWWE